MKKIGYIHRYSATEQKGILVYDWNCGPNWTSNPPKLFNINQCKKPVKTGMLVYFTIDDQNNVNNIEQASILNFDRDLLLSYVSKYRGNSFDRYSDVATIGYQNITELTEEISYSFNDILDEDITPEAQAFTKTEKKATTLDDWLDDIFNQVDFDNLPVIEYSKISIPEAIEEEYALFGKPFLHLTDYNFPTIVIDILNPAFWITPEVKHNDTFYGINKFEFIDLFEILFNYRRTSYENYLNHLRFSKGEYFRNLDERDQRYIHPELFPNNCISTNWTLLLNKFSYDDIKEIFCTYKILQPLLPETFCSEHIDLLDEKYGFPSVSIAELFLTNSITQINTPTAYQNIRDLLHAVKDCNKKHLDEEGIPLCAIPKEKLNQLLIKLDSKETQILHYIKNRILSSNSYQNDIAQLLENISDENLMLQIGLFYDSIDQFIDLLSNESYSICKIYDPFILDSPIIRTYNSFPANIRPIFDSYLSQLLKHKLSQPETISNRTPFDLNFILDNFSKWIGEGYVNEIGNTIANIYSNSSNISHLKEAYKFKFIPEKTFISRYYELSKGQSVNAYLDDLIDCNRYNLPDEIQFYILNRTFKSLDLTFSKYPDKNQSFIFPRDIEISSLEDFLLWMKDNTDLEDSTIFIAPISTKVYHQIEKKILKKLTIDERWRLFETDLISTPGIDNIRLKLSTGYKNYNLNEQYFTSDCFQRQMAHDIIDIDDPLLIFNIANKLSPKYIKSAYTRATGLCKLYLWSLNPNKAIDWDCLLQHFNKLSGCAQKRIFRYLFYSQTYHKVNSKKNILNILFQLLSNYHGSMSNISIDNETKLNNTIQLNPNQNVLNALHFLTIILEIKSKDYNQPITLKNISSHLSLTKENIHPILNEIKDFFEECNGWHLYSDYPNSKYLRTGYIDRINLEGKDFYILRFYNTPIDYYGNEDYSTISNIDFAESVLTKNFNTKKLDTEIINGYLISEKESHRLKEYMIDYHIDDMCNIFNSNVQFGNNLEYLSDVPTYTHPRFCYKEKTLFICNCSTFKDSDPIENIPFTWCKKLPCRSRPMFLNPNWEEYKFSDLLWSILNEKVTTTELWQINSEICAFINNLVTLEWESSSILESRQLNMEDEIGDWPSKMDIIAYGYDLESQEESYEEFDDEDHDQSFENETFECYNGSWAQDAEGYSDYDIDTIFDGNPDAYWNID